jgi:hypothetical protein
MSVGERSSSECQLFLPPHTHNFEGKSESLGTPPNSPRTLDEQHLSVTKRLSTHCRRNTVTGCCSFDTSTDLLPGCIGTLQSRAQVHHRQVGVSVTTMESSSYDARAEGRCRLILIRTWNLLDHPPQAENPDHPPFRGQHTAIDELLEPEQLRLPPQRARAVLHERYRVREQEDPDWTVPPYPPQLDQAASRAL